MGSHTRPDQSNTSHTMNTKLVLLFAFICAASGRVFLIDDGEVEQFRVRRDAPPSYGPPGRVGPVYTFVKTDPQANFKWGVRHRAGAQYEDRKDERDITDLVQIERYI